MQYLSTRSELRCISDYTIRETRTKSNQKITLTDPKVRCLSSMHANHTGIFGIVSVHDTFSHQGIAYGSIQNFSKLPHFLIGSGNHCTAADIDKRSLCFFHQSNGFLNICIGIFTGIFKRKRLLLFIFTGVGRYILGNIHKHRSRSSFLRDPEGLTDCIRQLCNIFYNIAVLRDRHGHTGNIHLLEGILAK